MCFQSQDSSKAPTVGVLPWVHFLAKAPPARDKRIRGKIGPLLQRYKKLETLGTFFHIKLNQNSEIHVFKSGIVLKYPTVDILPRIHCLGTSRKSITFQDLLADM